MNKVAIRKDGIGYGPDYSGRAEDGNHDIYYISGVTGPGVFYLHRFTNAGKPYSAIYKGHIELYVVESDKEELMLERFMIAKKLV